MPELLAELLAEFTAVCFCFHSSTSLGLATGTAAVFTLCTATEANAELVLVACVWLRKRVARGKRPVCA